MNNQLLRSALIRQLSSDRTALIGPQKDFSLSYAQLGREAERLTGAVAQHHPHLPRRVALMMPAGPEFAIAAAAIIRWGGAFAPIDPGLRGQSLADALETLRPDILIVRRGRGRALRAHAVLPPTYGIDCPAESGPPRLRIETEIAPAPAAANSDHGPDDRVPVLDDLVSASDDALLLATSGTTGKPKYVRLSQSAVFHNIRMHLAAFGLEGAPYRALQLLPVNYSYGLVASFLATLVGGGTLVFPEHPDRRHIRLAIERHRPRVCLGTPAFFRYLLEECPADDLAALRTLAVIGVGGDACHPPQRAFMREVLPASAIHITYGTTECGPRVATLAPELLLEKAGSIGRAFPEARIEIRTEEGALCGPGETGFLHIQTPSLMTGYLNTDGNADDLPRDHWYKTGDLAHIDAEGDIFLHGRADRQWKFRGRRINPATIERSLFGHASVLAVRAERFAAPNGEEKIRLIVHHRPAAGSALHKELTLLCRSNLPGYLVPHELVLNEDAQIYFKGKRWTAQPGATPAASANDPQRSVVA